MTILAVADLARASAFYAQAFAWPLAITAPNYHEFALPNGQRLGVYARAGFSANTGQAVAPPPAAAQTTATELYFYVDDMASALMRLRAAGARPLAPLASRAWGDVAAYFSDLDGNVIVLAQPATRAGTAPPSALHPPPCG